MARWIVGVFLVICLAVGLYFVFRPKDECDYVTHTRQAGVDFGATVQHVTAVKGNLGLTESDVATLDQFRQDYGLKYETLCKDFRDRHVLSKDEYNCRRNNMDKVLDQFRLLATISSTDQAKATQALQAIREFASSGPSAGCTPTAKLAVDPVEMLILETQPESGVQITNLGEKDAHYFVERLPRAFVATPASGLITAKQTIGVNFVRTIQPLPGGPIDFIIKDDFNEEIPLHIRVREGNNDVYSKLSSDLKKSSSNPSLQDALAFVDHTSPGVKSETARYLIAANILSKAGNKEAAVGAAELATAKDSSVHIEPLLNAGNPMESLRNYGQVDMFTKDPSGQAASAADMGEHAVQPPATPKRNAKHRTDTQYADQTATPRHPPV